ncbi:cytochrome c [Methanomethylovorans sp.]|uniref:c-type cytochrome n=1 Tax=Methanomethylovorans sp. TaxID=2758717 RepID=UPI00351C3B27
MTKFETYFLALIGIAIVAVLIMILYMMSLQTAGYNTYGPGYGSMMGSGYYEGGMMGAGYGQQGGMMGSGYAYPYNVEGIKTEFESNGETIYYTGSNETGKRIQISYGTQWLYVHGGGCVNCHGVDGKGGVPVMMGYTVPADITYNSLTTEEIPPYTDETIKTAIRDGLEPSGELLAPTMPRWQMSDKDLNDTLQYIKTL